MLARCAQCGELLPPGYVGTACAACKEAMDELDRACAPGGRIAKDIDRSLEDRRAQRRRVRR